MGVRQDIERMVDQIEEESQESYFAPGPTLQAAPRVGKGAGSLPALFLTFTCAVYKWAQLHSMLEKLLLAEEVAGRVPLDKLSEEEKRKRYDQDSVGHHSFLSWYCAIKLEQMVHLAANMITKQLEHTYFDASEWDIRDGEFDQDDSETMQTKRPPAQRPKSLPPKVDDWYASFELGSGGVVHVHLILWVEGAPRIDVAVKLTSEGDSPQGWKERVPEEDTVVLDEDVAAIVACFYDAPSTTYRSRQMVRRPTRWGRARRHGGRVWNVIWQTLAPCPRWRCSTCCHQRR